MPICAKYGAPNVRISGSVASNEVDCGQHDLPVLKLAVQRLLKQLEGLSE
ncbi:MAG: hypothetical protein RML36_00540 [Anaerolineae bacterium]|nr:hypothetical protein [Anaerolineae bacterium]